MVTRIVRIGNSQGIRIPKPLIEQAGLSGEVRIDVRGNCLAHESPTAQSSGTLASNHFQLWNRDSDLPVGMRLIPFSQFSSGCCCRGER